MDKIKYGAKTYLLLLLIYHIGFSDNSQYFLAHGSTSYITNLYYYTLHAGRASHFSEMSAMVTNYITYLPRWLYDFLSGFPQS